MVVALAEGGLEFSEGTGIDGLSRAAHQAKVKIKIMKRKQSQSQHFSRLEEMAEVGTGEVGQMGVAIPGQGSLITFEAGILYVNRTIGSEGQAVASGAGGVHAIEHVHPPRNHFQYLGRSAQSHCVTRFVGREEGFAVIDCTKHLFFRFSHGDAADGIAVKVERTEVAGG